MSTVKVDMRNLVYNLCSRREVPLLVTDIIGGYLVRRDLFNINTLSRDLHTQANAIIYREVVVDLDGSEKSVKTASLLFRTLLISETAAQAVRTLSLAGDHLQSWRMSLRRDDESIERPLRGLTPPGIHADLADFTKGEIQLYQKVAALHLASTRPTTSEVPIWALYLHVFHLAPHIQDFSVTSDYFRFPDFRSTLQDIFRTPLLEKLRSCSLCLDLPSPSGDRHASVVRDWDSTLLMSLTVPGIQSVAAVASLQSEAVRQLHLRGSSIRKLILHHYQIQDFDLSSLLAATPNLRYLQYHATSDYSYLGSGKGGAVWEHRAGLEPLYDALHIVADHLQELHTSHVIREDSCHNATGHWGELYEHIFRQRRELTSLKRLHALTIPFSTLLGWRRTDVVQDWDNILPSSLRQITLTDHLQDNCTQDEWTDEDLMPVISRLVKWLSAQRGDGVPRRFGLKLAILHCDFNEPVRQQLARICEERSVQCSIEKVHADVYRSPPRAPPPRPRGMIPSARGRSMSFRGYH
jgi:hypothetical protein